VDCRHCGVIATVWSRESSHEFKSRGKGFRVWGVDVSQSGFIKKKEKGINRVIYSMLGTPICFRRSGGRQLKTSPRRKKREQIAEHRRK